MINHVIDVRTSTLFDFLNFYRNHGWPEEEVLQIMLSLKARGVIKSMEYNSFTRTHHEDTEIKASELNAIVLCPWLNAIHAVTLGGQTNANDCIE